MPVLGLVGSAFFTEAARLGLRTVAEAFADRAYQPDGRLVSRREQGAVLHDPDVIAERVVAMVGAGQVTAVDGSVVDIEVESVCVHGDSPGRSISPPPCDVISSRRGVELAAFT